MMGDVAGGEAFVYWCYVGSFVLHLIFLTNEAMKVRVHHKPVRSSCCV